MAISWPARIKDKGGIRWQFHHVIDIVPTILELTGIPAPVMVDGVEQKPIEGVSMAYTFDPAAAGLDAPSAHKIQYFELMGVQGFYNDGWMLSAVPICPSWELLGPAILDPASAFKYDGLGFAALEFNNISGLGRSGTGTFKVDGRVVSTQKMEHTVPLTLPWDETFDIGSDTGAPVDDQDYQVPFRFTASSKS